MSTATIWLLFFVVVALTLLIAALTKTKFTVQKISIIGIMAALSFVAFPAVWPVPSAWRWRISWPVTLATPSPALS